MKHMIFNTAQDVTNFLNESPAKKIIGICSDKDGKFVVFYRDRYYWTSDEECEGENEE